MIANNLAKIRNKRGMIQSQLARALGIDQGDYSRAESGRYLLDMAQLQIVADKLDCKPDDIYPAAVMQYLLMQTNKNKAREKPKYKTLRVPVALAEKAEGRAQQEGYTGAAEYMLAAIRAKMEGE